MDPLDSVRSLCQALLIGLLVGVQRESTEGTHPGLRDFVARSDKVMHGLILLGMRQRPHGAVLHGS